MQSTKYTEIGAAIEASIKKGEYSTKLPPVRTLSEQFKVSTRTMGKALELLEQKGLIIPNGPRGIFIADQSCGGAARHNNGLIACFLRLYDPINDYDNYFNEVNQVIESRLTHKGFSLHKPWLCQFLTWGAIIEGGMATQLKDKALELDSSVDGFLLDEWIPDNIIEELRLKLTKPVVVVNRNSRAGVDSVSPDNIGGARRAAEIALKMGYETFLVGRNQPVVQNFEERTSAFISALRDAGRPEASIIEFEFNIRPYQEEFESLRQYIGNGSRSLIFTPEAGFSRWAADALTGRGIEVGKDTGVLCFDSTGASNRRKPRLSAMSVNPRDVGAASADILIARINRFPLGEKRNHPPEAVFNMGETL